MDKRKRNAFKKLFTTFMRKYAKTPAGKRHAELFPQVRQQAERSWNAIQKAANLGESVTDRALLRLFPHADSTENIEQGAWIHVHPIVPREARDILLPTSQHDTFDWDALVSELIVLVARCTEHPGQLIDACQHLATLEISRCLTSDLVSPILNALVPDTLVLLNPSTRNVVGYLTGQRLTNTLSGYPAAAEAAVKVMEELAPILKAGDALTEHRSDLFGMFCWWLVEITNQPLQKADAWRLSLQDASWEHWRSEGFVALGRKEVDDLQGVSRAQFVTQRDRLLSESNGKPTPKRLKSDIELVWRFAQGIHEGDHIVVSSSTSRVVGMGTVVGRYYHVPDAPLSHRLPVRWYDLSPRTLSKNARWRQALTRLTDARFKALQNAPVERKEAQPDAPEPPRLEFPFTAQSFELLQALEATPTKRCYQTYRDGLKRHIEWPFQQVLMTIGEHLPMAIKEVLETKERLFGRFLKNDFGRGGAWEFYWGALYLKGSKRLESPQLYVRISSTVLEFGFDIGEYATQHRERFARNCREHKPMLSHILREVFHDKHITFGHREPPNPTETKRPDWNQWLTDPLYHGVRIAVEIPRDEVVRIGTDPLVRVILRTFERMFPLILLTNDDDPLQSISEYLGEGVTQVELTDSVEEDVAPQKALDEIVEITGLDEPTLTRWVTAIERKGQAIIYGPPGTGKTYLAELLAQHLVDGGAGFSELVQFHPAYSYEDFIQGIRPQVREDGALEYAMVPGRFLQFCRRAAGRDGRCVLIIDEINRADLSRVFGELMYLLEYRDREIPLSAGGLFRIPSNVRIIGTMNTADRSIALVDYALRRRFVFINLKPNYQILSRYHSTGTFPVEGLVAVLKALNQAIGDRHYAVGIAFFLRDDLETCLEDVWRMEIEPYLEEYFFDQPDKVERFRWESIQQQILP